MEERNPPSTATTASHHRYDKNGTKVVPCGHTYIVQIPKNQVYRVPPPEHAKIVERHRHRDHQTRRCTPRMCWCLSTLLTLAVIITAVVCVCNLTLNPKPPYFSVQHFLVKRAKKNGSTQFSIAIGISNANRVNDVAFGPGNATLMYAGDAVAKGNVPRIDVVQAGKRRDGVNVVLEGSSKKGLPEKSKSKSPVDLNLGVSVPVKMKTWMLDKKRVVKVECLFEVSSLGDNAKVLSQKCEIED